MKEKKRLCLIYNFAQHYRASIFSLMDRELDCDFVFGDRYLDIKKMDYSVFRHKVEEVHNVKIGPFGYQQKVLRLIWKSYDKYIMLGDPQCLSTWGVLLFAKLVRKKVFLWSHAWYGRESLGKKIVKKMFFGLSNGVLLYGNYARNLMIQNGFNPNKLFVIYNSLDYDKQVSVRNKLMPSRIYIDHFKNGNPVLLFVGRLTKVKRLDMLVQVVKMAADENRPVNLVLIGTGEQQKELQQLVKDLGVGQYVWFYGASYNEEELSKLIYNADLCVAPGNVGLTAMHALVYGCPVVTHDNFKEQMPEFEAIEAGKTGDFFKQNSVDSLYKVVCSWLEQHKDREKVRQEAYHEIDSKWNPHVQLQVIRKALNV